VQEPLQALIADSVSNLCKKFLERVDDDLFLSARDAGNNVDETRYLDGQRELRGRHDLVLEKVPEKIALGVSILGNPRAEREKDGGSTKLSNLSLIEKDEFEDFLAVSEIVSELEPEFSEQLFGLRRRLTYLANRDLDLSAVPIGPSVVCNAIAECLKGLQSDQPLVSKVYRVLHQSMSADLGEMYEAVNALLIEHDVLPVINADTPVLKRPPKPPASFDAPVPEAIDDTIGTPTPVPEDEFVDLMPGPEDYQGRVAPQASPPTSPSQPAGRAPAGPVPAPMQPNGGVQAAPPAYPGDGVQAAPPAYPSGGVQAAPPAYPSGGVQAAPPAYPSGGVQAAPPAYPSGGVQAAPPAYPGGGVQAAPPAYPGADVEAGSAGGVEAAPPAYPGADVQGAPSVSTVEGVQAAPANVAGAGAVTGGSAARRSYGGWSSPPVQYAAPTVPRAYSAAQAQLALRRDLLPESGAGAQPISDTLRQRGAYSNTQIMDGLAEIQGDYVDSQAGAGNGALDVETIKQRIVDALINDGAPEKMISDQAVDGIEVVANLFTSLLQDALVAKNAKSQLTRLQPSVHRAALMDADFFQSDDHPVRQVINRISRLRDGSSTEQIERAGQVEALVSRINNDFHDDVGLFDEVVTELDGILSDQEAEYDDRIADVVQSCEQQQQILESRRGQSLEGTDAQNVRSDLPEEWNKWLERSRKLEVGQRVLMNATSSRAAVITLVWKEASDNLFVFVDEQGNKASTLTLQQVAMNLRRSVIVLLDGEEEEPALERAMAGVVERIHSQVEAQATRDGLTGFLLRKYFVEEIERILPDAESVAARNAAICHLSIENLREISEANGATAGDALLAALAERLKELVRGKNIVFGRLDDAVFGIYWPTGGIQGAYKKMQAIIGPLQEAIGGAAHEPDNAATVEFGATTAERPSGLGSAAQIVAGISGTGESLLEAEGLLSAAREACDSAREMGVGSLFVAGGENEQRQQLEQLVAYADSALERGFLFLTGQHIVSLADTSLSPALYVAVGAEDRNGKPIPAHVFAPALTRTASAAAIDLWVFKQTLSWMVEHDDDVEQHALIVIPISAASIKNEELPSLIMAEFMETPVPPGRICFAMPDQDVVENVAEVDDLINTLKEFGCHFVLDEFGSGHDNYDYIKGLDVDFVTVKTSFISDASKNQKRFCDGEVD